MPPLEFREYTSSERASLKEARDIERRAGGKLNEMLRTRSHTENEWLHSFRVTRGKGYDTPRAFYPSDYLAANQRTAAWVREYGLGSDKGSELFVQIQEEKDGQWTDTGNKLLVATIDHIWGSVEYEGDSEAMEDEERVRLATEFSETIDLITEAYETSRS